MEFVKMSELYNLLKKLEREGREFASHAEDHASEFHEILSNTNRFISDVSHILMDSDNLTREIVQDLSGRFDLLKEELASSIAHAGILNYAGHVKQADATEDLGTKIIAASVIANRQKIDPEGIIARNIEVLLGNVALAEINNEDVSFDQMVHRSGGDKNLTSVALQRLLQMKCAVEIKLKDGRFVLRVNQDSDFLREKFPFLSESDDFVGDLFRRLSIIHGG